MKRIFLIICIGLVFSFSIYLEGKGGKMIVENGRKVSFDYVLTVEGEIIDKSLPEQPFQYTHGEGQIIPGLAKGLEGMSVGEEKEIRIPPQEAYGLHDPQAFYEISSKSLPKDLKPQIGMYLQMRTPEGRTLPVRISEIKENTIVLDLNHPLAGKTLIFHVKIREIE